jgi:hypothetical protein
MVSQGGILRAYNDVIPAKGDRPNGWIRGRRPLSERDKLIPLGKGHRTDSEGYDGCAACFEGFEDQYKIIYTRPKKRKKREDDLW